MQTSVSLVGAVKTVYELHTLRPMLKDGFMSFREDLIYLPALLMDMSTGSVTLGVTFFASRLGASPLAIGIMASVSTFLYILFCHVFGRLSDRVNRKRVPQIACLSLAALYFLMPLCKRLGQLVVLFPFTGVALSALWPALEAWIGARGDSQLLIKRVRMFNLFWTGGLMIGYTTGGYISDLQVFAPFYLACISALCAAAAITIQPSPATGEPESRKTGGPDSWPSGLPAFRLLSWTANFVSYLTLGIMRYIFPKLIYELGMAPRVFGVLMLCQTGAQFLMFSILGATDRWHYKFAPLAIFQILASSGFLCIWLINSPRFWALGLMIIGLNVGMTYFSSMYYSLCGHVDLGSKSGWHESILHSGSLISTLIGGALANYVGIKSPYLFCAAAAVAGLPAQALILRKKKKTTKLVL
jgi:DHA1 family multidrug resistance protein-like MFS transporter